MSVEPGSGFTRNRPKEAVESTSTTSGTPSQMTWCHAQLGVEGDTGHHLCDRPAGHGGPHACDACRLTWSDGDRPKPVVEL